MSLDPVRKTYGWNCTNPNREGYSIDIWGTVLNVQDVQKYSYVSPEERAQGKQSKPMYWDDGNPVMNQRLILATPDGSVKTVTYEKAGKKAKQGQKPSLHMDLFRLCNGMKELIGKTVHISTQEPPQGTRYGSGNPRPFHVELGDPNVPPYEAKEIIPAEFMLERVVADQAAHGGQMAGAPQMQGGFYAAPQAAPMARQPVYQQPMVAQQMAPQAVQYQQAVPNMAQAVEQGLDPVVGQGLDPVVPQQVAPMPQQQMTDPYYDDCPF